MPRRGARASRSPSAARHGDVTAWLVARRLGSWENCSHDAPSNPVDRCWCGLRVRAARGLRIRRGGERLARCRRVRRHRQGSRSAQGRQHAPDARRGEADLVSHQARGGRGEGEPHLRQLLRFVPRRRRNQRLRAQRREDAHGQGARPHHARPLPLPRLRPGRPPRRRQRRLDGVARLHAVPGSRHSELLAVCTQIHVGRPLLHQRSRPQLSRPQLRPRSAGRVGPRQPQHHAAEALLGLRSAGFHAHPRRRPENLHRAVGVPLLQDPLDSRRAPGRHQLEVLWLELLPPARSVVDVRRHRQRSQRPRLEERRVVRRVGQGHRRPARCPTSPGS